MKLTSCRWFSVCISPHLDAIVAALSKFCDDFVFLYASEDQGAMRREVGWEKHTAYEARKYESEDALSLCEAELYIDNLRRLDIIEARAKNSKLSVYMGERWFKPPVGFFRVLVPSYFKMAKRFFKSFQTGNVFLFPSGIHAVRDILRLFGLLRGNLRSLFASPKVAFESRPGGRVYDLKQAFRLGLISKCDLEEGLDVGYVQIPQENWDDKTYSSAFKNIYLGGYIVETATGEISLSKNRLSNVESGTKERPFRMLWAGRMLSWKRVDVLISAVRKLIKEGFHVSLLVVGKGAERDSLMNLAKPFCSEISDDIYLNINEGRFEDIGTIFQDQKIIFSPYLKNSVIQDLMSNEIDLYVMPSDGGEGWGAVVSEALLAECPVLSTYEAGSSATLLPKDLLYHSKSVKSLCCAFEKQTFYVPCDVASRWTGGKYATAIRDLMKRG